MSTLGDAKMPTLRDKIEASAEKEAIVEEKTVKAKKGKGRSQVKIKKVVGEKVKKIPKSKNL